MKKILLTILILIGLNINLFAIWPTDEVISDVFNPDFHYLSVGATSYDILNPTQQDLLQHPTAYCIINPVQTNLLQNPTAYVIINPVQQTLLQNPTAYITQSQIDSLNAEVHASSKAVTEKLTDIQNTLNAGTTTYEKNPAKLYEGQTVYESSGTAGHITSATGITITILDKVTDFYFLYESPSSELCKIEPSIFGVPITLGDGKFCNVPVKYPVATTFTVSDMVVGSSLTWIIPTCK
jgi:hypothetical protein